MANRAWKFMQIEPQPARGVLREEMWEDPNWVAEEKYDGDRRIAQFCGDVVRFTGRRKSVKDGLFVEKSGNVPHLAGMVLDTEEGYIGKAPPRELDGTVLDGEMIVDYIDVSKVPLKFNEGRSKYVTSIMGARPEEAIQKQIERGWLHYVVFDCLFFKGECSILLPQRSRRQLARKAVEIWCNPFAYVGSMCATGSKISFYENVLLKGGEGVILKDSGASYGDNKAWVKVKKQWTADVIITGFEPAKKESKKKSGEVSATKYAAAGLIGAVVCGQYDFSTHDAHPSVDPMVEVASVSGMDDALRADITNHPKKYLGKVLRIKHNGREPTGRFRHPRWDCLVDKDPSTCVLDLEEK